MKRIGDLAQPIFDRIKARRQSTDRWWMDRAGNVHLNMDSLNRKPITLAELEAIDEAVRDFATNSREVH